MVYFGKLYFLQDLFEVNLGIFPKKGQLETLKRTQNNQIVWVRIITKFMHIKAPMKKNNYINNSVQKKTSYSVCSVTHKEKNSQPTAMTWLLIPTTVYGSIQNYWSKHYPECVWKQHQCTEICLCINQVKWNVKVNETETETVMKTVS